MSNPTTDNPPANTPANIPVIGSKVIDTAKAIKMRLQGGMTYREIGNAFGVDKSTVHKHLKPFIALLRNPGAIQSYRDSRADLLTSAELALLSDIANADRRKKASLNNTAYALRQVHDMRALEEGKPTARVDFDVRESRFDDEFRALIREVREHGSPEDVAIIEAEYETVNGGNETD